MAGEPDRVTGLRRLYVCLTRAVTSLVVLHTRGAARRAGGMTLAGRWPLDGAEDVRDALLAAYADPSRGYHDTLHLTEVLDRLDELAEAGEVFDPAHGAAGGVVPRRRVRRAARRRGAVRPLGRGRPARGRAAGRDGGRGRSPGPDDRAAPAGRRRPRRPGAQRRRPRDPGGRPGALRGLRREPCGASTPTSPTTTSATGRAAVLRDLLAKPHLFHTAHGRATWEATARAPTWPASCAARTPTCGAAAPRPPAATPALARTPAGRPPRPAGRRTPPARRSGPARSPGRGCRAPAANACSSSYDASLTRCDHRRPCAGTIGGSIRITARPSPAAAARTGRTRRPRRTWRTDRAAPGVPTWNWVTPARDEPRHVLGHQAAGGHQQAGHVRVARRRAPAGRRTPATRPCGEPPDRTAVRPGSMHESAPGPAPGRGSRRSARWKVHGTPGSAWASASQVSTSTSRSVSRKPNTTPSAPSPRYSSASPTRRVNSPPGGRVRSR